MPPRATGFHRFVFHMCFECLVPKKVRGDGGKLIKKKKAWSEIRAYNTNTHRYIHKQTHNHVSKYTWYGTMIDLQPLLGMAIRCVDIYC